VGGRGLGGAGEFEDTGKRAGIDHAALGEIDRHVVDVDQKAVDPGRRVVAGVTQAVLDRVGDVVSERRGGLQVSVEHRHRREAGLFEPRLGHHRRLLGAGRENDDVALAEQVDRVAQEGGSGRVRREMGRRAVRRVDPLANLDRHVETGRVDERALRHLHAEAAGGGGGERTRMLGQDAVEVDR